jgi:IPTL-CTERM motif
MRGFSMINKNRISIFIVAFLIVGFLFLALPEKGYSQVGTCCQGDGFCLDSGELSPCPPFTSKAGGSCSANTCSGGPPGLPGPEPTVVPTISEWGLIAMAGILGVVGFMVLRRKRITA